MALRVEQAVRAYEAIVVHGLHDRDARSCQANVKRWGQQRENVVDVDDVRLLLADEVNRAANDSRRQQQPPAERQAGMHTVVEVAAAHGKLDNLVAMLAQQRNLHWHALIFPTRFAIVVVTDDDLHGGAVLVVVEVTGCHYSTEVTFAEGKLRQFPGYRQPSHM